MTKHWRDSETSRLLRAISSLDKRAGKTLQLINVPDEDLEPDSDISNAILFLRELNQFRTPISEELSKTINDKYSSLHFSIAPGPLVGACKLYEQMEATHASATELIDHLVNHDNILYGSLSAIFMKWRTVYNVEHQLRNLMHKCDLKIAEIQRQSLSIGPKLGNRFGKYYDSINYTLNDKIILGEEINRHARLKELEEVKQTVAQFILEELREHPGYELVRSIWKDYCDVREQVITRLPSEASRSPSPAINLGDGSDLTGLQEVKALLASLKAKLTKDVGEPAELVGDERDLPQGDDVNTSPAPAVSESPESSTTPAVIVQEPNTQSCSLLRWREFFVGSTGRVVATVGFSTMLLSAIIGIAVFETVVNTSIALSANPALIGVLCLAALTCAALIVGLTGAGVACREKPSQGFCLSVSKTVSREEMLHS